MFLELARPKSWIWSGGGVQFLLKCLRIQLVFLFKIPLVPYRHTKSLKIIKWLPSDTEHFDPVLDHFGAATVAIPGIFGFQT